MSAKKGAQAGNVLVKLIVNANTAKAAPPVGPALGSKGVKAIDFCKEFNARTAHYDESVPIPALVTVKPDRTFTFELKSPPTAWLLKRAAGIEKGSPDPIRVKVGTISLKHVYEIAKIKKTDDRHKNIPMENVVKSILGVAKSVGIEVVP